MTTTEAERSWRVRLLVAALEPGDFKAFTSEMRSLLDPLDERCLADDEILMGIDRIDSALSAWELAATRLVVDHDCRLDNALRELRRAALAVFSPEHGRADRVRELTESHMTRGSF